MASERRRATYPAAGRMARILYGLLERPNGWSFEAIQEEMAISERTLLRYLALLKEELVDVEGRPLVEVFRRADRRLLRFAHHRAVPESNSYDVAFLYFALTVFQFLDGTVIKEGVEGLWERLSKTLPQKEKVRLADFPKKFYAIPYAVKDYREFDETLDVIVQSLVHQHRMRIDYGGLYGEGRVHTFDPYTLTMYRGGLYLLGKSAKGPKIITLAVERIRSAEKMERRFDYPKQYRPEKQTEGAFGIMFEQEPTRVEVLIMNPETLTYLQSRRLHPTQEFRKRRDGKVVLSMNVRGTDELRNWIFSFGPYLKVLRPKQLRDEVRAQLRAAVDLYGG